MTQRTTVESQDADIDQRMPDDVIEGEFERKDSGSRALVPTYDVPASISDYWVRKPVPLPRDLVDVERRLMQEANLAGEDMYYAWGEGKDRIEGGSIILAMAVARCWGNCVVEQLPLQETRDAYVFTARFIDLETGFTYDRQFRQSKKWTVYGKLDAARKEDIRFNIGQSKAARNAILRALPEYLKNKAIAKAKEGVRERLEHYIAKNGIALAQKIVLDALGKEGVPVERILDHYRIVDTTALDIDKIVEMRGNLNAIQKGEEHADTLYPPTQAEADATDPAAADKAKRAQDDLDAIAKSLAGNGTKAATVASTVAPPKPPAMATPPKPPTVAADKLALLRNLLALTPTVEALDKSWAAFFNEHKLTEAEMVPAETIYGEQWKRITQADAPPLPTVQQQATHNGQTVKTEPLPGPSEAVKEFAKRLNNSQTGPGVRKVLELAGREPFSPADMAFMQAETQKRLDQLAKKE